MEQYRRKPDCHPDKKHEAFGLCKSCYNREKGYTPGARPQWERKYYKLKYKCKDKNLPFTISKDKLKEIKEGVCHYCGCRGEMEIERLTPSLGYTDDNCVPACNSCNRVKADLLSEEEMHLIVTLLKNHRNTPNLWG